MATGTERASLLAGSEPVFDIVCIPCNTEGKHLEAEGYCMDCCEHLCVQCFKYHRTLSALKKHKLVDKDNMPMDQKYSVRKDICIDACNAHKDMVIEYFCPNHQVLGCNVCMTLKHKQCEGVAYIPEVSADLEHSLEYSNFKKQLDDLIQKSHVFFNSSEQNLKTSASFYSRVQRDICNFRQEINTALDKMETGIKNELEQIHTEYIEELQLVSREASRVNGELQAIAANFQELVSKKQNCQMFIQMKYTLSDLSKLQDKLKKIGDTGLQVYKFSPNGELLHLLKGANALGTVHNTCELKADRVADIKARSKLISKKCEIAGMSLVSKERLVIIDSKNDTVKLIDLANNKIISELKLENVSRTLTAITSSKVAVMQSSTEKIVLLTCNDKLVIDKRISVQGRCGNITYYQNKLIVTFLYPGKLEILDMTGKLLQRLEKDNQGKQLLIEPYYVSVDKKEPAMFVSDWGNGSLTKMSMDGKVLAQYTDRELIIPTQSVIDQAGLVYLCGESSHNIHLLTTDCTKLKIILTQSDGLQSPLAITYCETTGRLYVGMYETDKIKVYQLHY